MPENSEFSFKSIKMKKFFLTLTAIFTLSGMFAQIDRELVLVEIATGTWCGFCPGAAMGADDLAENGDPVAIIENHGYQGSSDPFVNQYSIARIDYYNIDGYPRAKFDGEWGTVNGGYPNQSMYPQYIAMVDARMEIQTDFSIGIYGTNDGDDYDIKIIVVKEGDYSGTNLWVRLALTESHIQYNWQNQSELNFVNRLMVPDATGTAVDFNDNDTAEVNLSFTFNNDWDINECELVAFIQNDDDKYNQHSDKVMITDLEEWNGGGGGGGNDTSFQAGFYADDTLFCSAPAVAHFYDTTINGNPISWNWYFEGGIPETSLDENPVVTYLDEGSFDVQLIVSDGTELDTVYVEDYIVVSSPPDVYWEDVPDLCNQGDDPYLLTEGRPEGGVYSGEFVSDGKYFHSTQAGVGEHVVTYTYTNENGCVDSADYTITVDECVGIGENESVGIELFPNPTNGLLNINISAKDFTGAGLKVLNILGKEVYSQDNLNIKGNFSTLIDLSSQPGGLYFVVISGGDQKVVRKIMLNK